MALTAVAGGAGLVGVGVVFVGVVAVGFLTGAEATDASEPHEVAKPEAEVTWLFVAEDVPAAAPAHRPSDAVAVAITAEQEARWRRMGG